MLKWKRLAAASLILSFSALPVLAAGAASPAGFWQSTDGQARVRVTMCGDGTQLCARLTGLSGTMVHNAAYLVPRLRSDEFATAVGRAATDNLDVHVDARGPWPPYSFAMLDDQ